MTKNNRVLKVFYTFLLTGFTMHIFLLNIETQDLSLYKDATGVYKFFMSIFLSIENFDICWITFFIFIFYFYYHTYFDNSKFNRKKIIAVIGAISMSIITIVGKSLSLYNNFSLITQSLSQVYKCFIIGLGYYFMYYAVLIKIFNLKLNEQDSKKKLQK